MKHTASLKSLRDKEQSKSVLRFGTMRKSKKEAQLVVPVLFEVVRQENMPTLKKMVKTYGKKEVVSALNEYGQSSLHIAADFGSPEVVAYLLDLGADPNLKDKATGWTPLFNACNKGSMNVIVLLLNAGADSSVLSKDRASCLHYFCRLDCCAKNAGRRCAVLKELISRCPEIVDLPNVNGETPLHRTCKVGNFRFMGILLDKGANPNAVDGFGMGTLHNTVIPLETNKGDLGTRKNCIRRLIEFRASLNAGDVPVLEMLKDETTVKIIKEIVDDVESTEDWSDAASEASEAPPPDVPKVAPSSYFLEPPASPAKQDIKLVGAKRLSFEDMAPHLRAEISRLQKAKEVQIEGSDPQSARLKLVPKGNKLSQKLISAIETGDEGLVDQLLTEPDLNPSYQDSSGWSILHAACSVGSLRVVKSLLDMESCDVSTMLTQDKATPLHYLVRKDPKMFEEPKTFFRVVEKLIEARCDPNARQKGRETAFHAAVWNGRCLAAAHLALNKEWKVDVNAVNTYGMSALHMAVQTRNVDMVRFLLSLKVNASTEGPEGTAVDMASRMNLEEIVDLLEEYADPDVVYSEASEEERKKRDEKVRVLIEACSRKALPCLNLSKMALSRVPERVFSLTHLKELNLSSNNLSSVPEEVTRLEALEELRLDRNALEELPTAMGFMPNLKRMNLALNTPLLPVLKAQYCVSVWNLLLHLRLTDRKLMDQECKEISQLELDGPVGPGAAASVQEYTKTIEEYLSLDEGEEVELVGEDCTTDTLRLRDQVEERERRLAKELAKIEEQKEALRRKQSELEEREQQLMDAAREPQS